MIEISGETIVRGFWVAILSGAMAYVVYDAGHGAQVQRKMDRATARCLGAKCCRCIWCAFSG